MFTVNMNKLTLKNKNGNVIIFENMVHIAQQDFYDVVIKDITDARAAGMVHLYECVKRNNMDAPSELNALLGLSLVNGTLGDLYQLFAWLTGMVPQKVADFITDFDIHADATEEELIEFINDNDIIINKKHDLDLNKLKTIKEKMEQHPPTKEILETMHLIVKRFISVILNVKCFFDKFKWWKSPRDTVLLDYRNKILTDKTIETIESGKDVIITYGAAHFKGFFKMLKENDPSWRIVASEKRRVF